MTSRSSRRSIQQALIEQLMVQQESQHSVLLHRISSLEAQVSYMPACGLAPTCCSAVFPDPFAWQFWVMPECQNGVSDYTQILKRDVGIQCDSVRHEASTQTTDCDGACELSSSPDRVHATKAIAWVSLAKASLAIHEIQRIQAWMRPKSAAPNSDEALANVQQAVRDAYDGRPSAISPSSSDLKGTARVCCLVNALPNKINLLSGVGPLKARKAACRAWRDHFVCRCVHHMGEHGADYKSAFLACADVAFEGELQRQPDLASQLLQAYHRIPKYHASTPKKKRKAKRTRQDYPVDHQHTQESEHQVAQLPLYDVKKLLVRNTFIDGMSESSSHNMPGFACSCPGKFAASIDCGVAKLVASTCDGVDVQRLDCATTIFAELAQNDEADDAGMVDLQEPAQVPCQCADCRSEDPSGWEDPLGRFYCLFCWERWRGADIDPCSGSAGHHDDGAGNAGCAEIYDQLDPICGTPKRDCRIILQSGNWFDIAAATKGSCLVLLGSNNFIGPTTPSWEEPPKGILYSLCQRSTFQKDAVGKGVMVPRKGGVYAPEVTIFKDSRGDRISGSHAAVLYATCPWPAFEDEIDGEARFRNEFRDTVLNALRVCYKHGHKHLLIGSRFSMLPKSTVAQVFRNVLLDQWDTCNIFEQVMFAMCPNNCEDEMIKAFANEFLDCL